MYVWKFVSSRDDRDREARACVRACVSRRQLLQLPMRAGPAGREGKGQQGGGPKKKAPLVDDALLILSLSFCFSELLLLSQKGAPPSSASWLPWIILEEGEALDAKVQACPFRTHAWQRSVSLSLPREKAKATMCATAD